MRRGYHKIATVSRLSGFSPELLRAWEQRHKLLAPARGPGGQRLYSDEDLRVLRGVRALLDQGFAIGEIAAGGRRHLLDAARQRDAAATEAAAPNGASGDEPAWAPPGRAASQAVSEQKAARALELAAQAIACLSARLPPEQLLDLIVDTLATDFQAALARIWVYEPDEQVLLLRASAGLSRQTSQSSRARIDLRRYRYKVGVVARNREPFLSVAIVPLTTRDGLQGVLALFFRVALSEQIVGALQLFATVAASSIAAHRPVAVSSSASRL
jgi:DNA-binding transcriptional MerR regulator